MYPDERHEFVRAKEAEGNMPMHGRLRKIADEPIPCLSPEHNPPGMIVLDPGTYEHTCPACGKKTVFTVKGTYL